MTSIGTVFVNVQPDTSGFAERLRAGLSRVSTEDIKVKATPDTGGFVERLRADLSRVRAEDIKVKAVPDTAGFTQRLRADLARAAAEDIKVKAVPDTSGFTQRLRTDLAHASAEDIKVKAVPDTSGFTQRLRADLARASAEDIKVKVTPDTSTFRARLRADLARAVTESIKIKAEPDTSGFASRLRAELARFNENLKVNVVPDTSGFRATLRADLAAVGTDLKINVQPDFSGFRDAVRLELRWIEAHEKLTIRVNADSDHLRQEVRDAIIRAQAGQRITIPINAGGGPGGIGGVGGAGGGGLSGSLGGLMGVPSTAMAAAYTAAAVAATGLAGAATALAGALAPVAALMGAAIPAAAIGLAQAFGAASAAFKGVIGAIQAYGAVQKNASTDAVTAANQQRAHATAIRSATNSIATAQDALRQAYERAGRVREDSARAIQDAERGLARTQQDVSDANAQAAQRVEDAEQRVHDAQVNAREAQQELNDARRQAVEDLDDMRRSLRQTALDERGGILSVQEAQQRLNEVRADPKSTELERQRAKLSYDQAVASLDDIRDRLGDQKEQYSQASRAGVEGTDRVRQAEKNVADATSQVTGAQRDLVDAHRAQARAATDGQQAIADAQRAVSDAFRNQKQAQEDSARAIQQAQRGLKEAQEQLATAIQSSMDTGSSSTRKFADAMNALSPIGRQLVNTIISLQPAWQNLQRLTQQAMFPGVLDAINNIKGTLPNLTDILVRTAGAMGDLAREFGRMFSSSVWQRDIRTVGLANVTILRNLGMAGLNVLDIFRNLSAAVAPFIVQLSGLVRHLTDTWKQQVETARQTGVLNDLFRRGMDVLLQLGRIAGNTFSGIWSILKVGYPYGKQLLDLIEGWSAKFKTWTKTAEGQTRLNEFFRGSVTIFKLIAAAVGGAVAWLFDMVAMLGRVTDWDRTHGNGLKLLFQDLAGFVERVGRILRDTLERQLENVSAWYSRNHDTILELWKNLGDTVQWAADHVGILVAAFAAFKVGGWIYAGAQGVIGLLENIGQVTRFLGVSAGSFVAVGAGLVFLGVTLAQLWRTSESFRTAVRNLFSELKYWVSDIILPAFRVLVDFWKQYLVPIVGNVLTPAIQGLTTALRWIRDAINNNKDAFRTLNDAIKPVLQIIRDDLAPILGGILKGALLTIGAVVSGLVYVFGGLVRTLSGLGILKPLLLTLAGAFMPLITATVVIRGVIAAVKELIDWFKDFPTHISHAASAIGDFFERLPGRIVGFLGSAGRLLLGIGKTIIDGLVTGITTAASAVWDFFKRLPDRIFGAIGFAAGWLIRTGIQVVQGFTSGLLSAAAGIADFFTRLPGRIMGFLGDAGRWLMRTGLEAMAGLLNGLSSAGGGVWNFFKGLPAKIGSFIVNAPTWLLDKGKDIVRGIANGLAAGASAVWDFFTHLPGRIKNTMLNALGWLLQTGKDVISGLFRGLLEGVAAIGTWIYDHIFKPFINGFKHAFGIDSPAKAMLSIGRDIIGGLLNGILDAIKAVGTWLWQHVGLPIVNAFKTAGTWLINAGKSILGGLLSGLGAIGDIAAWIWGHIAVPIANAFRTAGTWLLDAGKRVLGGLRDGIGNVGAVFGAVGRWFWDHVGAPFVSGLGNLGTTLGSWLINAGKAVLGGLRTGISKFGEVFGAIGKWFWDNVGSPFVQGLGNLPSTLGSWLFEAGKWVLRGLFNGIKGAVGEAGNIIGDIKDGVVNTFKHVFGIGSPATVMIPLGQSITDGLRTGINNGTAGVLTAIGGLKTGVINSINGIPTAAKDAARIMGNAFGDMGGRTTTLATTTATQTGRIVSSHNSMSTGVSTAGGRVVGSLNAQDVKTKLTQANHDLRMAQIRAQADRMQASVAGAVGRYMGDLGRQDDRTNRTQANHNLRMGQVRGQADAMQRGIGATVGRFIGNLQSQDNQTNRTQVNHGTRMGQINTASSNMARNTEGATGRVNRAYGGMQGTVDRLHGKNIGVSSTASVRYPPDSVLTAGVKRAIDIVSHAFVANGAIFQRANGSIDNLPNQAIISPVRGPGIVQWAEAETGGEAFIPLSPTKRARSLQIWRETGRLLGAFADGGLLNILTSLDQDDWMNKTNRLQTLSESHATQIGQAAAKKLGEAAGAGLGQLLVSWLSAPHGPGYSMSGSWAAGIRPWVQYIASKLNISAGTYTGHHPAESHAVDLAVGQAGMVNTAPATGPSGNDLYSRIARWIDANILAKPTPGWYVGTHAAIHSRGGSWHPASSQVGRRGQTFAHDDHVHVSFDPRYDGAPWGIPGNYSAPNFNWDEGRGAPAAAAPASTPAGSHGRYSQAQMEAAILAAGLPANIAHIFGAIGMQESGGWNFPSTNQYGTFHSPWAMIAGQPGVDDARMDTDLNYAAQQVAALYRRAGFDPWEAFTSGRFAQFMAEGGILDRFGRMFMADGGLLKLLRRRQKKRLDPGDEDWGAEQSVIRGVRGRTFDQGGWLEPGITIAQNKTGRPERVVAPHQEFAAGGIRTNPFIIGDSISWLSRKELLSKIPGASFAAFPGVQWPWGVSQLHANPPHANVVYLLGTNFGASAAQMSSLLNSNPLSKFVLMTLSIPQKWETATNAAVRATKNRNPWRVAIADWHAAVAAHPSYLGPDRVHPNTAAGRSAFANVAAGALNSLARFAAALQSLEFNRILKLRTLAAPYLDHKPADYNTWSGNQQFAYWARFPAVVTLLKAIHQKEIEGWFKKVSGHNYLYGRRFPDFAQGGIRLPNNRYDQGGWLQPGITIAANTTGRAERVVAPNTEDKTVALLIQLVGIMGEQNRLLKLLPGAQADALNNVAARALL